MSADDVRAAVDELVGEHGDSARAGLHPLPEQSRLLEQGLRRGEAVEPGDRVGAGFAVSCLDETWTRLESSRPVPSYLCVLAAPWAPA